jgi:hypothetical protein
VSLVLSELTADVVQEMGERKFCGERLIERNLKAKNTKRRCSK